MLLESCFSKAPYHAIFNFFEREQLETLTCELTWTWFAQSDLVLSGPEWPGLPRPGQPRRTEQSQGKPKPTHRWLFEGFNSIAADLVMWAQSVAAEIETNILVFPLQLIKPK